MLQQTGTSACGMRDQLWSAYISKKITPKKITEKMSNMDIPTWLRSEIVSMVRFNELKRCTCPVEQAMFQAVCNHIVRELVESERKGQ